MKRILLTCILLVVSGVIFCHADVANVKIVRSSDASSSERLASAELVRYLYLRTGQLLNVTEGNRLPRCDSIVVAVKGSKIVSGAEKLGAEELGPQQYIVKTTAEKGIKTVWIVGGDDVGALYGTYRFLEKLGIRFYLHEDVVPDDKIELSLPDLDEVGKPLFELRGLNPWGSHVEGIDLWDADQYKAVFTQMAKMRMNSMMIHSYPKPSGLDNDPHVWIGVSDDIDENGNVSFSSTSSQWNTERQKWGYKPVKTGNFLFGGSLLFESDWWGCDVMAGQFPLATEFQGRNEVFNRAGKKFNEAFTFARKLGVKTGLGTEAGILGPSYKQKTLKDGEKLNLREHGPSIVIPREVQQRLKAQGKDPKDPAVLQEVYEGIFRRIAKTHPLDYYLVFTQESWYWAGIDEQMFDVLIEEWDIILKAWKNVKPEFGLATCGWVLGPDFDHGAWDKALPKHVAISEMSPAYNAPVDQLFAGIQGRQKWAIPWIEEDTPILTPCLWASRVRKDVADALAYGCTGFMTLHWRTRILETSSSAMAMACWNQSGWNPEFEKAKPAAPKSTFRIDEPVDGPVAIGYIQEADIGNIPIDGTEDDKVYQTGRNQLGGYRLKVPNGKYRVVLKFAETLKSVPYAGVRYFDVLLQDKLVIEKLDIFARAGGKFKALDVGFDDVEVSNGWLKVGLNMRSSWPCLMGLEVYGEKYTRKINVGGEDYKDYEGDLHWYVPTDTFLWGKRSYNIPPRGLDVDDFYDDWAHAMFGGEIGDAAGKIFAELDGRIPLVSMWAGVNGYCAGGLTPDQRYWKDVSAEFEFVAELQELRPMVRGAGNLERFDYWLNTLRYTRAAAEAKCIWGRLRNAMKQARAEEDADKKKTIAKEKVLPIYTELVEKVGQACTLQLATVSDVGGLATVLNWEGHNNMLNIRENGKELAEMLGEELDAHAVASTKYQGEPRIIVPTIRTLLDNGESLKLKVIILDNELPKTAALYWRPLGKGEFNKLDLRHVSRAVYSAALPAAEESFEYYIQAKTKGGKGIIWPATAGKMNQTVVVRN